MELFYATIILLLGTALGEETVTVSISPSHHVDIGEDVTITWKVRQITDTTVLKLRKVVMYKNEDGEEELVEQNILSSETPVLYTKPYEESRRYTYTKTEVGTTGYDVKLEITNAQSEDNGIFGLYIVVSQVSRTQLLDVFTKPDEVHFVNFTDGDDMEFDDGETRDVRCMAMGGVPLPRLSIMVGAVNYTRFFKHKEAEVKLPECYSDNIQDSCILHPITDSSITAFDWSPDISAHRKKLVCSASHPDSEEEPKTTDISVRMEYKPKFRCFQKQKVALHTTDFLLKCSVAASPGIDADDDEDDVHFEINVDGKTEKLELGDVSSNMEFEFLSMQQDQYEEQTNVTLKIKEVFEHHYDMKFILKATNELGTNTTALELVPEDFVRGSASFVCTGILTLIAGLLSFIAL